MTEKTCISKEIAKCVKDKSYNPDRAIMKQITEQINCSLPWSQFKLEGMEDCKSENDFEFYLSTIVKLQSKIKKVPKKCTFKTWTPLPYSKSSTDGKDTLIVIELSIIDSKVWNTAPKIRIPKIIKVTLLIVSFQAIIKEEEEYMYSIDYFIGICGGYLGLFLGESILGILESFEGILTRIFNHSSN